MHATGSMITPVHFMSRGSCGRWYYGFIQWTTRDLCNHTYIHTYIQIATVQSCKCKYQSANVNVNVNVSVIVTVNVDVNVTVNVNLSVIVTVSVNAHWEALCGTTASCRDLSIPTYAGPGRLAPALSSKTRFPRFALQDAAAPMPEFSLAANAVSTSA